MNWFWNLNDTTDYHDSQGVAVVVRWFVLATWLALLNAQPELPEGRLLTLNLLAVPSIVVNGYVSWLLRTPRKITARHVYALSLLDIALISIALSITTGFDNTFYVFYYPVLVGFSIVFQSRRTVFGLGVLAIGSYIVLSIWTEPGINTGVFEERILIARVVTMTGVVVAANFISRIERSRRIAAVEAEQERAAENLELQRKAMTAEIAVTRERGRIAREIHDGIAQQVYMLGLGIETAIAVADKDPAGVKERLTGLLPTAKQTLLHTRNYLYDLKPLMDGEQDLVTLARNQAEEFTSVTGLEVEIAIDGEPRSVEVDRAMALYRIIQESLANVLKHAQASEVKLALLFEPDWVRVAIQDDGVGFDVGSHHVGYGLTNLRERAEELGGTVEMATGAGQGTVVTVRVPV